MRRYPVILLAGLGLAVLPACSERIPTRKAIALQGYGYETVGVFKDDAKTNTQVNPDALEWTLVDTRGEKVDLKQYRGKKNLVLVFTRGFAGFVCPNCSAQTSRLISNYKEFEKRDAEVLVVFPGPSDHVSDFVQASQSAAGDAKVPFPILLDGNFSVVDKLGIRGDLAKPSTYILDKQGQVRFAYVGATTTDRPSLKAMLDQLDELAKK